jgi:acyl carrier protein
VIEVIEERMNAFIAREIMFGKGAGLSRDTPLLEWGLINSLEMRALIAFIEREFSVHVPPEQVIAKNFASIAALARMTRGLLEASSGPTSAPTLAGVARR